MKFLFLCQLVIILFIISGGAVAADISDATEECIDCHATITPGIVSDWQRSRHAQLTPSEALDNNVIKRRISTADIKPELADVAVGCAECHLLNPESHADTFDHNDQKVHIVVTPDDCAVCHPVESNEYKDNIMSHAYSNLMDNDLYGSLMNSINNAGHFDGQTLFKDSPNEMENSQSCLYCHGTEVKTIGSQTRETELGEMDFPVLSGWPNQGVGRINPDGSRGACSSCHARHQFSIEVARKPHTCAECHKGPDVPAYKVYQVSKHGNIYSSLGDQWFFDNVPWVVGEDFTTPTCAACHISLLTDADDNVLAERTHAMNNRLDKRIFGLVYSHPYPKSPLTSIIVNKAGLPLPTELTGEPVEEFLIDETEAARRREAMEKVCLGCHSSQWTKNHFTGLDHTIKMTDKSTLAATNILKKAWEKNLAEGLLHGKSVFDEVIEKKWVTQWLFYANSCRFSAAMAGADYGVFDYGRWNLSENLQEMYEWLKDHSED
jgi:hypothetical protein